MTSTAEEARRQGLALALLCIAEFMIVLDFSIVNVALHSMQKDLSLSTQNLQWVVSAYSLTLGGFLLLGGRMADLYGRRLLFILGLVLFSLASLAGGLAPSNVWLIIARAVQGLGAALVAPTALSLITTTFAEGSARNKAFGLVGALASAGFAAGAILGGLLTAGPGWRWVMFVNVPIGLAAVLAAPFLLRESRAQVNQRRVDVFGALTVTMGLIVLVYTLSQGNEIGWLSLKAFGMLALAAALLAAFVVIEIRSAFPLVRLGIFRQRTVTGANLVSMLAPGAFGALGFILTPCMQQVGSGLVLAIVVAVSSARTTALLQQRGNTSKVAVTAGLQYALFACIGFALLAALAALFVIRERKDTPDPQHTPVTKDDSSNRPTSSSPITVGKGERQHR